MTHGSLFSGIGGFENGAEWVGIETLWNCEIEPFQRSILKKHFPNTKQYEDIKELSNPGYVDIISGGFPCQDISIAGKGVGITGSRSGLWSEMHRVIREVRPRYVIIENSPMLLVRGFERVLCDLSKTGYDAEWQCLSNAAFGFDHHRERVYVIAYSNEIKQQTWRVQEWNKAQTIFVPPPKQHGRFPLSERIYKMPDREHIGINDGIRDWTHRVGSIGNAVNPTVAKYLFECIKIFDSNLKKDIHHS